MKTIGILGGMSWESTVTYYQLINRAVNHRVDVLHSAKVSSRNALVSVAHELVKEGSEAIILSCTELGLLINHSDLSVPIFDCTYLHAQAAVDFCLR